ncbi:MAG: NUDIX domain-containing protein [Caldilineaceae bacterium]|nr:NUDIX domain-containing protein [Caldilineaceae bacterium]
MTELATTWDGLPISPEAPFGALIVVYRRGVAGVELLVLHRTHNGPTYEGDWAWTPPSGARLPNEPIDACARRELLEETGLTLPLQATGQGLDSWAVYTAEATPDSAIVLDAEHDRFEWVKLDVALARCLPEPVAQSIRTVAGLLRL